MALADSAPRLFAARFVARLGARRQLVVRALLAATGWPGWRSWRPATAFGRACSGLTPGRDRVRPVICPHDPGRYERGPGAPAGLASGLLNTTPQMGGAIGLAVTELSPPLSTLTHPRIKLVAAALTSGYDRGLAVCAGVLVAGALVALFFPARPKKTRAPVTESEGLRSSMESGQSPAVVEPRPAFDLVQPRAGN